MYKSIFLFLLIFVSYLSVAQDIPNAPNPPRLVNDFAGILSADEKAGLEEKLVQYDDTTSTQIAVVTVSSLNGYDVADFAIRLAEKWGIGRNQKDNGVLLLIAPQEKRVTIQVGYGLEGAIPDITANQIIQNEIRPNFQNNDYYGGIDAAVNALMQAAAGEYEAEPRESEDDYGGGSSPLFIIFLIILIIIIISRNNRNKGGGKTYRGRRGPVFTPWIFGSGGSGGSSWGGGGSSGGGGFGGFGGGSFGGGGASGSW